MESSQPGSASESFYSAALGRITRIMRWLMVGAPGVAWFYLGWREAVGLLCGVLIAYLNFFWLERVIVALAAKATEQSAGEPGRRVVLRFLFRYVLMGLAAYATLTVFPASLRGLLVGLFLPVAGIACEAAYETYAALSRGI